jgi:hypothetical protein
MKRFALMLVVAGLTVAGLVFVTQAADAPPPRVERQDSYVHTVLTVQSVSRTARLIPSYTAITTTGSAFANDGSVILHCKNVDDSDSTLTIDAVGKIDGLTIADVTAVISATTGDIFIGPFNPTYFNQTNGNVQFTSSVTDNDTTCAPLKIPR